jgi:lipopolysaccharide transport system permease protein
MKELLQNRDLISQLLKRDVLERYRGSNLGLLWSFMYPVFMLLIYMFVFGIIFKMKWGIAPGSGDVPTDVPFGVIMFSGLVLHAFLGECLTRSSSLIIGNQQYVKKVVFPLPVLSVVCIGAALFHLFAGLVILFVFMMLAGTFPSMTIFYVPLVLLPFILLMLGVSWLLSSLCVFIRDVAQLMGVLVTVLLFLAPIFYPLSIVPEQYQVWMYLNPLTAVVEQFRAVALFAQQPDWLVLGIYYVVALVVLFLGFAFFQRTKGAFADVV